MNSATIISALILSTIILLSTKKNFLVPFIIAACLIPVQQRIVIVDLDFTVLRILTLFGIMRLYLRGEVREVEWNLFDRIILLWCFTSSLVYIIQWGDMRAFIYQSGILLDRIGMYWMFRQAINSWEDITRIIRIFAITVIVSLPFIAMEKINESSVYSIFGPVGAVFHRGRFRCAGPFSHHIFLGCFWACLTPLFYARLKANESKLLFWSAIIASILSIYLSASSTPVLTFGAILLFWCLYSIRTYGRTIFLFFCFFIVLLDLAMKAPVWHLMSRVGVFGGSTGWYRYNLFDQFVNHVSGWFWLGTRSTTDWGMTDITNQFILEAIRGGAITLVLFVLVLYHSVKIAGRYSLLADNVGYGWIAWGVCVSLLGHIVTFWGVSYFGQIIMLLFLTFAIVGFMQEEMDRASIVAEE